MNEEKNLITNKLKDRLCFEVLTVEDEENLDSLNLDIEASNCVDKDDGFDMLLMLRNQQSLHQKAQSLLGRSFKNAVVHDRCSMRQKISD